MSEPDERQASPVALISAVGLVIVVLVVSIGWKIWLTSKEVAREAEVGTDAGAVAVVVDDVGVTVEAPIQPPAESLAETADAGFEGDEALQKPMEFEEPSEPEAEATASKAEEEERPRERRPTPAKKVGFKIESDPINATVTIDGRNVGSTPLDVDVESGDDAVEIRFSHIGYKNETVRVVPNESRNVRITLQKERLKFID